jgi:predicted DNA-binding transcriptional regulator YafY
MNYLTYTEKMNYLLEMIKNGRLYSLQQACEKFNCSKSTIKRMLQTLRDQGQPIKYCKISKKFIVEI